MAIGNRDWNEPSSSDLVRDKKESLKQAVLQYFNGWQSLILSTLQLMTYLEEIRVLGRAYKMAF